MKNKEIFMVIGIIIIALVLIVSLGKSDNGKTKEKVTDGQSILENAQKESAQVKDEEKKELTQITVDEYLDYYNGEDNNLVLVARPTCHYCQIAEPIIQKLAKEYDIDIKYLNTDNFSGDDESRFISSNEMFQEGFGTPMLLNVGNEKIVDYVDGLSDSEHYIEFFKSNGYIE